MTEKQIEQSNIFKSFKTEQWRNEALNALSTAYDRLTDDKKAFLDGNLNEKLLSALVLPAICIERLSIKCPKIVQTNERLKLQYDFDVYTIVSNSYLICDIGIMFDSVILSDFFKKQSSKLQTQHWLVSTEVNSDLIDACKLDSSKADLLIKENIWTLYSVDVKLTKLTLLEVITQLLQLKE